MDKTKIDWCDSSWNPVTGCLHGCKYCYARNIAHRFSGGGENWNDDETIVLNERMYDEDEGKAMAYPYGFKPTFHRYKLDEYANKTGRNIFVCSMADLFGDWVPDSWIREVFEACKKAPQHNYLFLTKNPERYTKHGVPTAKNMWYGTSITNSVEIGKFNYLPAFCNTFLSIEPILEDLSPEIWNIAFLQANWFIIGAETGRRENKVVPERKWIEDIVNECRKNGKPVFMKSSLATIWKEPLIQEFPDGLKKTGGSFNGEIDNKDRRICLREKRN